MDMLKQANEMEPTQKLDGIDMNTFWCARMRLFYTRISARLLSTSALLVNAVTRFRCYQAMNKSSTAATAKQERETAKEEI